MKRTLKREFKELEVVEMEGIWLLKNKLFIYKRHFVVWIKWFFYGKTIYVLLKRDWSDHENAHISCALFCDVQLKWKRTWIENKHDTQMKILI